jgi:hypothetical protein
MLQLLYKGAVLRDLLHVLLSDVLHLLLHLLHELLVLFVLLTQRPLQIDPVCVCVCVCE